MLDRPTIEAALRTGGWSSTDDVLRASATSLPDEGERWRFVSMAECARVLGSGVEGRDAAAQIRELVRLADGHLEIPTSMLQSASGLPWRDAALSCVAETEGRSVLELSDGFPIFDAVPDLRWAVKMEARSRRNTRPEAASAFLHRLSGHQEFSSDGQKAALHAVVTMPAGATLVAALPTGWGKSALFQVGARWWRESDPTACVVVLVPTVALAQDHARTLSRTPGLEGSRALVGGMKPAERRLVLEGFSEGEVPILLLSPEMALNGASAVLADVAARGAAGHDGGHLVAVVVDEAHIIETWGRYFRPDFQRLAGLVRELRQRQPSLRTLLLSATLDSELRERLKEDFGEGAVRDEVVVAEPRSEFDFAFAKVPQERRMDLVVEAADVLPRPAVVYTTTVEDAEALHGKLVARGYRRIELFTGQLEDPVERQRILHGWARGDIDLVIATSAFGMGVDKPNVRAIVHACVPEGADRLYQEIGRGGRDGHQSLSLCMWTDGDAAIAASMATNGWMRVETAAKRWRAIIRDAKDQDFFAHRRDGRLELKVPLDARHDDMERITGRLNRQWNMALLTQLQRSGALRIVREERTTAGAELWVTELIEPAIAEEAAADSGVLRRHLAVAASEVSEAREKASRLEAALRNEYGRCYREAIFDLVEPSGVPWPCGRCEACREADERPRDVPDRHEFRVTWEGIPWQQPTSLAPGSLVVSPDDPALADGLERLVGRLAALGIEQFVARDSLLGPLTDAVSKSTFRYGLTLLMGGGIPPARMPTAVIVETCLDRGESIRAQCMTIRARFEQQWRELPVVFVVSPDVTAQGVPLSQHLSSRAPCTEAELDRLARTK